MDVCPDLPTAAGPKRAPDERDGHIRAHHDLLSDLWSALPLTLQRYADDEIGPL